MTNYHLSYTGGGEMPADQETRDAVMAAWGAWFASLGEAVVDPGAMLGDRRVVGNGATDGRDRAVTTSGGYSIIRADDLDAATRLAQGCPLLQQGGQVHVAECLSA